MSNNLENLSPSLLNFEKCEWDLRAYAYLRNRKGQGTQMRTMLAYPIHIFKYITKERPSIKTKIWET